MREVSAESRGGESKWCKHDLGSSAESKNLLAPKKPLEQYSCTCPSWCRTIAIKALNEVYTTRYVNLCKSLTSFLKHLKTFYFQSAFPGTPSDPLPQLLQFSFWYWRFINSFAYSLTYWLH